MRLYDDRTQACEHTVLLAREINIPVADAACALLIAAKRLALSRSP